MKKKYVTMTCMALAMTTLLATSAMAGDTPAPAMGPAVRVNGAIVDFPDDQPFIDENSRTMIPVRFVAEEMGATVDWDGPSQTVTIRNDVATLMAKIGSADLKVASGGKTETVQMDTAAVIHGERTYVPIRFVAEALGANVDYSYKYHTVGIYNDRLSSADIVRLQNHARTQPIYAIGYEEAKTLFDESQLQALYGDRSGFDSFANAKEHLYHSMDRNGTYHFKSMGAMLKNSDTDTYFEYVVDEAIAELKHDTERLTVDFVADESCIYQADAMDRTTATVRGIVNATLHVSPLDLEPEETALLCELGFTQLVQNEQMHIDVDVHMNTQSNCNVNIHSIVPLGEAY